MCCQAQPPATTHNTIDSDLYTDVTNIINNSCLKFRKKKANKIYEALVTK